MYIWLILFCSIFSPVFADWMDSAVKREFSHFRDGFTSDVLENTWKRCKKSSNFQRYKIIKSKVYGPETSLKRFLYEIVKRYKVPDVDFIYYSHDALRKDFFKKSKDYAPIFVSAKSVNLRKTILFIDWYYDITDQNGGWNAMIQAIQESQEKWPTKINQLFWRGGTNDGYYTPLTWMTLPRGKLVYESKCLHNPLIDAAFVGIQSFACSDPQYFIPYSSPSIPVASQLKYKYHIDIDGVTSTFTAIQWKLLSGSLVMKQTTDQRMWYSSQLIPWKHYVPLKKDLSDLQEKLTWALEHDLEAEQIGKQGKEFAQTHLMPEHFLLYGYKVLKKYAALQKFKPS